MMNVRLAPEPSDFAQKVNAPGTAFLHSKPKPRSADWMGHDYWRRSMDDLLSAYSNICAYSGSHTHRSANSGRGGIIDSSVDHYLPKSKYPGQAYEWSNYRLSRARLNHRKGNFEDVLDPFELPCRWFALDFSTFMLRPNATLSDEEQDSIKATIDRLGLNDDDSTRERSDVVQLYCLNRLSFASVEKYWPYIASEMNTQSFDTSIRPGLPEAFLRPLVPDSYWLGVLK